jgi:hypothetical protein
MMANLKEDKCGFELRPDISPKYHGTDHELYDMYT